VEGGLRSLRGRPTPAQGVGVTLPRSTGTHRAAHMRGWPLLRLVGLSYQRLYTVLAVCNEPAINEPRGSELHE